MKTKFENECEELCRVCIASGHDLCHQAGAQEQEHARCGICGKVYCAEEASPELHLCAECEARIDQNIDVDNEIINANLFGNNE